MNHTPPSSYDGKNEWSCTSTPSVCLHGVDKGKPLPLYVYKWKYIENVCDTIIADNNGFAKIM
jgi:hypothetical protein